VRSHLVNDCSDVNTAWLDGVKTWGDAGARRRAPGRSLIGFWAGMGHLMEEIELVDEDGSRCRGTDVSVR